MLQQLPLSIAGSIKHFTGRTWLLDPLLRWLDQSESRIFVLTGAPGTGKSSIIAILAGAGSVPDTMPANHRLEYLRSVIKATHFCSAGSGESDPTTMAQNISTQLSLNVPGFFETLLETLPDHIRIDVQQRVGIIASGGSAVGVLIEHLYVGTLSEEANFNRLVRDPLKQLYKKGHNQPIVLLIDALDEAMTYTGSCNIVQLLAGLDDLPEFVRFLVTTRPDQRVLKYFRPSGAVLFDLVKQEPRGVNDVYSYLYNQLAMLAENKRVYFARRISEAAEGIFLYARLVLNDVIPQLSHLADVEALSLPKGLPGLYQQFLNRELGRSEERWYKEFRPLLGLLAVAQNGGFTRVQLEQIRGGDVEQSLRTLGQYLSGSWPDGPFRLFHHSFTDFLLTDKQNVDYHIEPSSMNRYLAAYYQKCYQERWEAIDTYGIEYLLSHLLGFDVNQRLRAIRSDEYAIHYLAKHALEAGRAGEIGKIVNLVLNP